MNRSALFLAASLVAFLCTNAALAVTCVPTPFAPCPSDTFQITDGNGHVLTDAHGNLASVTFPEVANEGGLTAVFDFAGVPTGLNRGVSLIEGSATFDGLPIVSDQITLGAANLAFGTVLRVIFVSDEDGQNGITNTADCTGDILNFCVQETGDVQDVTSLAFGNETPPFHILVQSDAPEVPEPGTVLLLSAGLAGLAVVGARRRRM